MTTVLITYDVDDVQAWLASPTRTATFESAGFTVRPFVDPTVANQVALLVERREPAPGRATLVAPYRPVRGRLEDLRQLISSPEAAERMRVRRRAQGDDDDVRRGVTLPRRRLAGGLPGRHGHELGAGPRAELGADVGQVPLDRA